MGRKTRSKDWKNVNTLLSDVSAIFFKTMYNKRIIRFGFCDILNNQGLGKCYQPRPSPRLITLTLTLLFRISQKPDPINGYYL